MSREQSPEFSLTQIYEDEGVEEHAYEETSRNKRLARTDSSSASLTQEARQVTSKNKAPSQVPKPASSGPAQSRAWLFTLNNYSSVDVPRTIPSYRYVVWQAERGASGTKHLQGYVVFTSPRKLSTVKNIFPTAHWESRLGSHEQAKQYCMKSDTREQGPWELGDDSNIASGQGARTDLLSLKRLVDEGATDLQLWEEQFQPMLRYHKGVGIYKRLKSTVRNFKTFVVVLTGPTGSGKSHQAFRFPNAYPLSHPGTKGGQIWFDGYDGHPTVIIDEFYGWIPYDLLLRLLDRFPLCVPTKGGFTNFAPKNIIITSNKDPQDWYHFQNYAGRAEPLLRRLDLVITKWNRTSYRVHKYPNMPSTNDIINIEDSDDIDFRRFCPDFQ